MGLRWRKVFVGGPARLNLSLRGIGTSIGIPGLRFGVSATGRKYVAIGIPGTGLYYWHYFGQRKNQPDQPEKNAANTPTAQSGRPPQADGTGPSMAGGWWNDAEFGGERR